MLSHANSQAGTHARRSHERPDELFTGPFVSTYSENILQRCNFLRRREPPGITREKGVPLLKRHGL